MNKSRFANLRNAVKAGRIAVRGPGKSARTEANALSKHLLETVWLPAIQQMNQKV